MPALPDRLREAAQGFSARPPGLGPPGPNPLFFGVLLSLLLGTLVGAFAGEGNRVAGSDLLYHLSVGGVAAAAFYAVVVVLWLAWHRRALKKLNLGLGSGETPGQDTAGEVTARDEEIKEFMETTTAAIEDLNSRLPKQE